MALLAMGCGSSLNPTIEDLTLVDVAKSAKLGSIQCIHNGSRVACERFPPANRARRYLCFVHSFSTIPQIYRPVGLIHLLLILPFHKWRVCTITELRRPQHRFLIIFALRWYCHFASITYTSSFCIFTFLKCISFLTSY